jgi:Bacterial tandem repeat domain 1
MWTLVSRRPRRARWGRTWHWYLAAAAAMVAQLAFLVAPALASSSVPSSVFDRDSVEWDFVFDRTSSQFAGDFAQRVSQGMMIVDLEVNDYSTLLQRADDDHTADHPNYYSAVWQRNVDGRAWQEWRDMTVSQFRQKHNQALTDNQRLVDFEAYTCDSDKSKECYAGVWVENREHLFSPFGALTFDRSASDLEFYINSQREAGMMAIDVEEYNVPGCLRCYAAIVVENREHLAWQIHWGLSSSEFADKFNQYRDAGYRMQAVTSHAQYDCPRLIGCAFGEHPAWSVYAGIWVENRNGRGWAEYRNMGWTDFDQRRRDYIAAGYRPIAFEEYKVPNGRECSTVGTNTACFNRYVMRYAMIWRQNT